MKAINFVNNMLKSSPIVWRSTGKKILCKEALINKDAVAELFTNLNSKDLDIVENTMKVLFSVAHNDPEKIIHLKADIVATAKRCQHFKICFFSKKIIESMLQLNPSVTTEITEIETMIKPKKIITGNSSQPYYSRDCRHDAEYILGGVDYRYQLNDVCHAFNYDCSKALKKVLRTMKKLGYEKNKLYWKDVPRRWSKGYSRNEVYKTRLHYSSYHSIQLFVMWCLENLPIKREAWDEYLIEQEGYEPIFTDDLIEDRPEFIKLDTKIETNKWLKQKIKRNEVYQSSNLDKDWTILYEDTRIRFEDKLFERDIASCFSKSSLNKVKNKADVFAPYYDCRNVNIDKVPEQAFFSGKLYISGGNLPEIESELVPSYGKISEKEYEGNYSPIFPCPELITALGLKQKKGTLNFYKDNELVIKNINWRNGFFFSVGHGGEDRFNQTNNGCILIIKTKHLKKYIKTNKLRLLSTGEISKSKIDKYGDSYEYKPENIKRKRFTFNITKLSI
jgi:hypothetical protein